MLVLVEIVSRPIETPRLKSNNFFQLSEARLCFNKTGQFRLLEICNNKIFLICRPEQRITELSVSMSHRIEEIPEDQILLLRKEMLVPFQHAQVGFQNI